MPSNWQVLGQANHGATGFGGFAGYNTQFERLVLGVEANYDQANLSLIAPNSPISRQTSAGGNAYDVTITGSGSVTDLNFGTLRARAGWALGNFLPYGFAGVAVGHANVNIAATVSGIENPQNQPCTPGGAATPACVPFSFTGTAGKSGEWMVGFTFGGGLDVALTRNVFLRAEYEYVQFAPIANLVVDVNSVRGGLGVNFYSFLSLAPACRSELQTGANPHARGAQPDIVRRAELDVVGSSPRTKNFCVSA